MAVPRDETADVVALWRLQSRYADIVTRRAWPELREIFLPEITVHLDTVTAPPQDFVGPDAVGAFISAAIERFDHFAFVILNAVLDVAGADEARGRMFIHEIRHDTASDTWQDAYGVYQDAYLRRAGRWWFAERSYRSLARTGREGVVLGIPKLGPLG
jgi:hypothetical protein